MQDKYRFRAWDKQEKKYIYGGEKGLNAVSQPTGNIRVLSIAEIDNSERYVLEQCSGLKDRDGRLIYEGDVVQVADGYERGRYLVILKDGFFAAEDANGWLSRLDEMLDDDDCIMRIVDDSERSDEIDSLEAELENCKEH